MKRRGADFSPSLKTLAPGSMADHAGPVGVTETPANMRQKPLPKNHPRYVEPPKKTNIVEGDEAIRFCLKHAIPIPEDGKMSEFFDYETAETTVISMVDRHAARRLARRSA